MLSLPKAPPPADVDDVPVHEELARALRAELAAVPALVIDLVDIAIAILRDAEANGGLLAQRLAELGARPGDLLPGLEELRSAGGGVATGSAVRYAAHPDGSPLLSDAAVLYLRFYEALRSRGLPDNAVWSAFGLVATRRGNTLATVVVRAVLQLQGGARRPDETPTPGCGPSACPGGSSRSRPPRWTS